MAISRTHLCHLVTLVLVAATLLAACGGPAASPVPPAGKPVVTILAPANASQVALNQPIPLQVNGTDATGVTRVEIKVDGVLVATAQGQGEQGQASLDAVQSWTFGQAGSHVITAQAYNAAGQVSDLASVTILAAADSASVVPVAAPTTPLTQVPAGPAETLQPCTLVTADEAAAIMGEPSGPAQEVSGGCAFTNASNSLYTVTVGAAQGAEAEGIAQGLVFVLGMAGVPLDEASVNELRALAEAQDWIGFFNKLASLSAGAASVKARLLEGVGDVGYWAWIDAQGRWQGALAIVRGDTLVNVNLVVAAGQQEEAMLQAATSLANAVFSRLPARFTLPASSAAPTALAEVPTTAPEPPTAAPKPPTAAPKPPTTVPKPVIASFTADPATITSGDPCTLHWQVTGAASVEIDNGVGTVAASGSKQVSPAGNVKYTLTARSAGGETAAEVTIQVYPPLAPPPQIKSFTADPGTIAAGGSSTLRWEVTGASSVEIDQGIGKVALTGSRQVSPAATTTYQIVASNSTSAVSAKVTVTVNPAGPTWGNWQKVGGKFTSAPTVASWNENRLDVFVRGTNTHLMHRTWRNSAWEGWEDLSGGLADSPTCVSWSAKRIDCFVRGASDSELWHRAYSGGQWYDWMKVGGKFEFAPTVASWAENRLDVFVRGTNSHLMHRWWTGSAWSGWEDLGGDLADAPACVSWGPNRLDCFIRNKSDSELWHRDWNGSKWEPWEKLGGVFTYAPTVASWAPNRLDVFVRGTNTHLMHRWWNGSAWTGWEDLGGELADAPTCVSRANLRLDCFVRGKGDSELWTRSFGE